MNDKSRLQFIDNIRVLLAILVILHHLAITYGAPGGWYYRENNQGQLDLFATTIFTILVALDQAFFLGLFFFLSGYFTPESYERKGAYFFIRDRLLRLGIPILLYLFVISPLLLYILNTVTAGRDFSITEYFQLYFNNQIGFDIGPLWFLEVLLFFTILYVFWQILFRRLERILPNRMKYPGNLVAILFALAIGVITFFVRIWLPVGSTFQPLNLQQFPFFPQYISMFIVGVLFQKYGWLIHLASDVRMGKVWMIWTLIFISFLPILFVLSGGLTGDISSALGGLHWQAVAYGIFEQFICVGMTISLLVLFKHKSDHQSILIKIMSANVFAVFVLHALILVCLTLLLRGIILHPVLKFILVAPLAVFLCFFISDLVRRLPLLNRVL